MSLLCMRLNETNKKVTDHKVDYTSICNPGIIYCIIIVYLCSCIKTKNVVILLIISKVDIIYPYLRILDKCALLIPFSGNHISKTPVKLTKKGSL